MGIICGDKRTTKLNESEKAILECKKCRDRIRSYMKRLTNREKQSRDKAKELLASKQRDRAKFYLRQAKLHSAQMKTYEGQLEMIEKQIAQIESSSNLAECMKVLKNGNEVLQKMQDNIKIEDWENLKDEMDELKEKDKEVSNFLKEYGIDEAQYDNEVNNDLDKLINEIEGNKAKEEIKLPEVPKEEITEDKNKNKKKEKEKSKKKLAVS